MDERRQLPRLGIKKEAKVWLPFIQAFCHCVIEDMHLKGMCVSFEKHFPVQQLMNMSFTMGDNFDLVKIQSQVPWSKENQGRYVYGLSFNKIAEADKDRIYQFLNTNCYEQIRDNWWKQGD